MRRVDSEPAFLLHLRPYRETSVLIEALCARQGRVGLIARGVRAVKPRWPRGVLEPFQALSIGFQGRGELAMLTAVDADAVLPRLTGDWLVAGLYANELTLRLLSRDDPHPEVYNAYRDCLVALHGQQSVAWVLRQFERDLLGALGYRPELDRDIQGRELDPECAYRIDPELGASATGNGFDPSRGVFSGADLLALASSALPPPETLQRLRRLTALLMRPHLGDRALRSSGLLLRARVLQQPE